MKRRKKISFILIALVFLVIIVAFLWNEKIDFEEKINDQKIANFFVTVFTIIGTIATIFYTIKQYKLSELVNRTNIKPDLYPKSYFFKMEDDESPLNIKGIDKGLYLTHALNLKHDFDLVIENIGVGIAKNVNFQWVYNLSEVEELIKGTYCLTPDDTYKSIEYLVPGKSIAIILPSKYLSCCGPKLFESFETKFFSNEETLNLPKGSDKLEVQITKWKEATFPKVRPELFLEVAYSDIQDFQYKKIFKTKVTGINNIVTFEFYRT